MKGSQKQIVLQRRDLLAPLDFGVKVPYAAMGNVMDRLAEKNPSYGCDRYSKLMSYFVCLFEILYSP